MPLPWAALLSLSSCLMFAFSMRKKISKVKQQLNFDFRFHPPHHPRPTCTRIKKCWTTRERDEKLCRKKNEFERVQRPSSLIYRVCNPECRTMNKQFSIFDDFSFLWRAVFLLLGLIRSLVQLLWNVVSDNVGSCEWQFSNYRWERERPNDAAKNIIAVGQIHCNFPHFEKIFAINEAYSFVMLSTRLWNVMIMNRVWNVAELTVHLLSNLKRVSTEHK